jgi:protein transport protein SEC13
LIKYWVFKDGKFNLQQELGGHEDWVRDVAWCNNIGLLHDTLASCSEDQKAKVWKRDSTTDRWEAKTEIAINAPAWKVSWSSVGNLLAVSGGDNIVHIYKEAPNGEYEAVSKVNDEGVLEEL